MLCDDEPALSRDPIFLCIRATEKNATPLQAAVHQSLACGTAPGMIFGWPPTKGYNMLDEEDPLTCEDTCDDWFQEPPNNQYQTGVSRLCERVQPAEVSKTCLTSPGCLPAKHRLGPLNRVSRFHGPDGDAADESQRV
jgi:hypothetical protein